ncbi:SDR family NAD(P)-dependent oxidoreductase [Sediminibacillus albus]|uniref:Short-chain dehydrogenase n=1 Tax=Sediminibacillus albus TaxID=407036 RepID=A0A1G8VJH3_9BACI|nr:SDR family oxidoreductase [Sediminibacillus albus]SDJ66074.1 hypothetical protein SAMN05216243_0146 [Sediminibacillus albus]
MEKLKGKKILVTGASGGLGASIAWHIAKQGGTPILVARSKDKIERLSKEISHHFSIKPPAYPADLTDLEQWEDILGIIIKDNQPIEGLVNNAGIGVFDYVHEASWEDFDNMFQLNVYALVKTVYQLLPHFLDNNKGHIINIASQAGKIATPKSSGYSASKHAVIGFSNALRMELAGKGILVTTVNPGPIRTGFFDRADPSGNYQRSVERYMLDADNVARTVVKHMFKRKREINLPLWMDTGSRLYQLFPGWFESIMKKQFSKK